jgi:hypothetical protein
MRALGAAGDAAGLDGVAKQAEICQVETHGFAAVRAPVRRARRLPSNSTKESYAKYLLSAKSLRIIFVVDESSAQSSAHGRSAETRIAARCDIG